MKILITLLFCCALTSGNYIFADDIDVIELRKLYYEASESKQYRDQFYKRVSIADDRSGTLLLCYKGMALFLRCKDQINPYFKLTDFNAGKKLLERAVKRDPENIEIRFMRFCIQSQAPRMLGYFGKLAEDKNMIIKGWKEIADQDLKDKIKAYMLVYGNFSEKDKTYLL